MFLYVCRDYSANLQIDLDFSFFLFFFVIINCIQIDLALLKRSRVLFYIN